MPKKAKAKAKVRGSLEDIPFIPALPPDLELLAADELAKGKSIDDIAKIVGEAAAGNLPPGPPQLDDQPASQPTAEPDEQEQKKTAFMQRTYYEAVARLASGQIYGHSLEEMDDMAAATSLPLVSFKTWCKRKDYLNG